MPNRWTVPREDPGHGGYGASIRKGLDRINLHGPENSKNSFLPSKRNRAGSLFPSFLYSLLYSTSPQQRGRRDLRPFLLETIYFSFHSSRRC